jgi:hypothetical protein
MRSGFRPCQSAQKVIGVDSDHSEAGWRASRGIACATRRAERVVAEVLARGGWDIGVCGRKYPKFGKSYSGAGASLETFGRSDSILFG